MVGMDLVKPLCHQFKEPSQTSTSWDINRFRRRFASMADMKVGEL